MRVLLVSTYELGHQPLHVASPAARLLEAGHEVRCLDLAVQSWDRGLLEWAQAVAISVPMHTGMRLGVRAAADVKRVRDDLPVCLYGLYAPISSDHTVGRVADRVLSGEYEPALLAWLGDDMPGGQSPGGGPVTIELGRGRADFTVPARHLLPELAEYAHLAIDGEERLVGYVETTHGCAHRCRHCPIPVVYDGAFRVVPEPIVLADIAALVESGARHITFGDPDFLNGPGHVLPILRGMHERWPQLTFDCTVKIEHVLAHARIWAEMRELGCLFVVTAMECTNDRILALLDKGHSHAEAIEAVALLRAHGIEPRPSFMPFTPWTTRQDLVDLVDFVAGHDLIGNVDPVQYGIRLLLPEGSLLLERPELAPHLGPYDPELLTYTWQAPDPALDELQTELSAMIERRVGAGDPIGAIFLEVARMVRACAGQPADEAIPVGSVEGRPRLTEPWFC